MEMKQFIPSALIASSTTGQQLSFRLIGHGFGKLKGIPPNIQPGKAKSNDGRREYTKGARLVAWVMKSAYPVPVLVRLLVALVLSQHPAKFALAASSQAVHYTLVGESRFSDECLI